MVKSYIRTNNYPLKLKYEMRKSFYQDKLRVEIFDNKEDMGQESASFVAEKLNLAIKDRGTANLILGTGASQFPFLDAFLKEDLDWMKINLFHLDEYIGLSDQHPASFRRFLKERIAVKVNPKNVFYINGDEDNMDAEIRRYEKLLKDNPVDVACIGIGENGHIAFNDPGVADFNDPEYLKIVEMDTACRKQQVGEGWFPTINDVPGKAITLTITAIMDSGVISCTVPDTRKSEAVYNALMGKISPACPASILRKHNNAVLFLDQYSSMRIL
jgi:glucosamine-6-phosphate deaminase